MSDEVAKFVEWETDLPADYNFSDYPPVVDRYYTKKFYRPEQKETPRRNWATTCVLHHTNGCCLICISPSHPIVSDDTITIKEIDFQTGPKTNRLDSKPVGKWKKEAQILKAEDELLCKIIVSSGVTYHLAAGARGRLTEINEQIRSNPSLVKSKPLTDGYIGIIIPPRRGYHFTAIHRPQDDFSESPPPNTQ